MVKSCCAYACVNEWNPNGEIKFHRFPMKNTEKLKQWLLAMRRKIFTPTSNTVICSAHFKDEDYLESSKNRIMLKPHAVPSIFKFPHYMLKASPKRRKLLIREEEPCEQEISVTNEHKTKPPVCDIATQTSGLKTEVEVKLRRQLKNVKLKVKRLDKTLKSTKDLIKHLKANKKCTTNIEEVLLNNFEGFSLELFRNQLKNSNKQKTQRRYSEEMRKFALTLNFYSPRAYTFLRRELNLPHSATLRKWLSSANCEVGFLSEVFDYLKTQVPDKPYLKDVALIFDSMAIRSAIVYDKKSDKHYGYADLGGIASVSNEEMATEVLVFQIVSFEKKFKCPIGYFFINKIPASVQKQLILVAIQKLFEIGINVKSITCDCCATNTKTLTLLGCNLTQDKMTPFFKNPCNNDYIVCILDPCHLLKILRNAFGEVTLSSPKGIISFTYIKKLHELQEKQDLKLANKLSYCHINFEQKKMNVRLAAQTISCSVANALEFLCQSGHSDFIGSEATVEFLRIFDRLFDVMNSRSSFATGYKSPMCLQNRHYWSNIFEESKKYILNLKAEGIDIVSRRRKTFAIGFLMNIISFEKLAIHFLSREENPLKYFLTYKCSQDHLELYFACIRSRGGWNDNPNPLQFKWTLRKLLFTNDIKPGVNSNCLGSDYNLTPIFESRITKHTVYGISDNDSIDEELLKLTSVVDRINLTNFQENVLYYIAGFVIRKIFKKNSCLHCRQMLLTQMYNDHDYNSMTSNHYASFTKFINQGKLYFPAKIVFNIVKFTERTFRAQVNMQFIGKGNFKQRIVTLVTQHFINNNLTKLFQPPHPVVDVHEDLHEVQIVKFIASTYCDIRIQTHAKKITLRSIGDKATIRHKLHKTILFYHV